MSQALLNNVNNKIDRFAYHSLGTAAVHSILDNIFEKSSYIILL